jgi:hypothetical protein
MSSTSTIPVTVDQEAAAYVQELGMQAPFEQMLEHTRQTMPGLRAIHVEFQPAYDVEFPCILLRATTDDPHLEDDPSECAWGQWKSDTFPPEVCEHFVLLVNYGWPDAR